MATFLRTMVRITDPERGRSFYETLGFMFAGDFDIVRDSQLEATNYFFSIGDQESVLELVQPRRAHVRPRHRLRAHRGRRWGPETRPSPR
jgi:catechol 2,3-dioxygenase-like lactoylglutathione lyase family enzyme